MPTKKNCEQKSTVCPCGRTFAWKLHSVKKRCRCGRIILRNSHIVLLRSGFSMRHEWIAALQQQGITAMTDDDIADGIQQLYDQYHSAAHVGRLLGFSYQAIVSHLSRMTRWVGGGSAKGHGVKIYVKWRGERRTLRDLAEEYQLSYQLIYGRLKRGWPMDDVMTIPRMQPGKHFAPRARDWSR